MISLAPSARSQNLASCHTCCRIQDAGLPHCQRCGARMHLRKPESVQRCLALLAFALLVYIPANLLPIMVVTKVGQAEPTTILSGVALFWEIQAYPIAITIFVASVLIPGLKLLALGTLCAAVSGKIALNPLLANRLYFLTELVGRWSMVDVFVVAISVGLVKFGSVLEIQSSLGAVLFALMVVLTMLAAQAFDPRLIWDRLREQDEL